MVFVFVFTRFRFTGLVGELGRIVDAEIARRQPQSLAQLLRVRIIRRTWSLVDGVDAAAAANRVHWFSRNRERTIATVRHWAAAPA